MYQKPDFVKVSLKVSDIFANYGTTGCPQDETGIWQFTQPCEGTDDYTFVYQTHTDMGWGHQCYTTYNK